MVERIALRIARRRKNLNSSENNLAERFGSGLSPIWTIMQKLHENSGKQKNDQTKRKMKRVRLKPCND